MGRNAYNSKRGYREDNFFSACEETRKTLRISEFIIADILSGENLQSRQNLIIKNVAGFRYPLKIVVSVEKDITTVISSIR